MIDRQRVQQTIFAAIDDVNGLLMPGQRLPKSAEAPLTGNDSVLDSLGLVNLIVATERKVEEEFGVGVTLVTQESMSRSESPFRSVGALAEYVQNLLEKKTNGATP